MCKEKQQIPEKMKQMQTIMNMCLEGIHIRLKIMVNNLIWHILIKCPELGSHS